MSGLEDSSASRLHSHKSGMRLCQPSGGGDLCRFLAIMPGAAGCELLRLRQGLGTSTTYLSDVAFGGCNGRQSDPGP